MTVLDASVLIAHLEATDAHHERAAGLIDELADDDVGVSWITLAEVLAGPARAGRLHGAYAALRELGIRGIRKGDDAPLRLATLRAETGLKLPDCCVLLAAEDVAAESIATFDGKLVTAARGMGFGVR
jgi:predicted nucleic acid-binding protein